MPSRRYHVRAGVFHLLLLILLWGSDLVVAGTFVSRPFLALARPYQEPALGPLGPLFELYLLLAALGIARIWWRSRSVPWRARRPYLAGILLWVVLGVHDGLASLGMPTVQYVMEYASGLFPGDPVGRLRQLLEIANEDKYRVITEGTQDGLLVLQDGKAVFGNPACEALLGRPALGADGEAFLAALAPEDRPGERLLREPSAPPGSASP
jgi:PAS domain-containing protein